MSDKTVGRYESRSEDPIKEQNAWVRALSFHVFFFSQNLPLELKVFKNSKNFSDRIERKGK
jgi:hypothetical protein